MQHDWQRILPLGIGIIYTTQVIIHMYVVTGISSNTGQTLPLISRGGSPLLTTPTVIGTYIGITRHIHEEEYQHQSEQESQAEAATEPVVETTSIIEENPRPTISGETNDIT